MTIAAALGESQKRKPVAMKAVAAWWHTVLLIVILLAIAVRGAMFQSAPAGTSPTHNVLPLYISVLITGLIFRQLAFDQPFVAARPGRDSG